MDVIKKLNNASIKESLPLALENFLNIIARHTGQIIPTVVELLNENLNNLLHLETSPPSNPTNRENVLYYLIMIIEMHGTTESKIKKISDDVAPDQLMDTLGCKHTSFTLTQGHQE